MGDNALKVTAVLIIPAKAIFYSLYEFVPLNCVTLKKMKCAFFTSVCICGFIKTVIVVLVEIRTKQSENERWLGPKIFKVYTMAA